MDAPRMISRNNSLTSRVDGTPLYLCVRSKGCRRDLAQVRARRDFLAASQLCHADVHGLLIERRFIADAPTQVNRLEAAAMGMAKTPQARKHPALQCVALLLQVIESGTDEYPEGSRGYWHGAGSEKPIISSF